MDDMFRKVQGLLAKAEGTDNENEAAAFMAKAHELMIRYAIDEARVREAMGQRTAAARPIVEEFEYSPHDGNAVGKKTLLHLIARANRVRMLNHLNRRGSNQHKGSKSTSNQYCTLVGYAADIEMVKMLYVSLLIQAVRFSGPQWKEHAERFGKTSGKAKWFTGYLVGFAEVIQRRMVEIGKMSMDASTSGLMLRVAAEVDDAFRTAFPSTKVGHSRSDSQGRMSGRIGGERADIGAPSLHRGALRIGSGR